MVDFRKKLNKTEIEKKTDPIEIYDSLDRRSIAGPLRPAQYNILERWYKSRINERDLIIKLHTGEGKTLIGLLILLSKLNANKGPCLFVCPNKYLVEQVKKDAEKFGINYCSIGSDNALPNDFIDGKRILITHVQKVFNGKTIFGLGQYYAHIENVILDDSHACIDSIRDSFTIKINRDNQVYKEVFDLFRDALTEQGEGTFLEIENGDYNSFLPIPYWNWIDKSEEILQILSQHREDTSIAFAWPFIKDNIRDCTAFVSGQTLEISPAHIPIEKFSSFHRASQRILMSATTQDDSFSIKGLGFSINAVKNPLHIPDQVWSGEKMILIPSLIDDSLDRLNIINTFAPPRKRNYGVACLVASFAKARIYSELGALMPDAEKIISVVNNLKKGHFEKTVIFSNRYDGIDLPDETCRILVIDGRPYFNSLADRYEESNRINSDVTNIKIAQKIEQGLGRSVRGEKDYCVIFIIGADLVKFIKSSRTNKYFSPQTKKQIEIGLEIAELAVDELSEKNKPFDALKSLVSQSLQRDEGWKEFYKEEMNKIKISDLRNTLYDTLILEREASILNHSGDCEKASNIIQKIIDNHCEDDIDRGWYLQQMARYKYLQSKVDSNTYQKAAFLKNRELLKPREGIVYKKLEFINENRIQRIIARIKAYNSYQELMLSVESVLADLEFGTSAEKFESAVAELGAFLGFLSERPDKEIKKGPDNLWCGVSNQYFIFECKSEVNIERQEINKHEASQMNTHCGWFENQYGDASVKRIMIIPTKNLSYHADFTHEVEIMRRGTLKTLRNNVKSFFKEFSKYELDSLTDTKIQEFIDTHELDIHSLKSLYSEKFYKKSH